MGKKDITQLEIQYLSESFNLTDGYAHRSLVGGELNIIKNMSAQFLSANRENQAKFESDYLEAYYTLTRQTLDAAKVSYMLLPAASFSLEVIANYLRTKGLGLALIDPCFDNLVNMFVRHGIALEPLPEELLVSDKIEYFLAGLQSDAICVVSPNNPTGIYYTEQNFRALVRFCKENDKLLIIDSSFRPYRPLDDVFDEYELLIQSGIDFIVVEDSGKTWPARGLKVSILAVAPRIAQDVYDIYTDFIYYHSPFIVGLITEFVKTSIADGLQVVHELPKNNRQSLAEAISGTCLEFADKSPTGLAWLKVTNHYTGDQIQELLAQNDVFVVAGRHFFWHDKSAGDKYIRVSLLRDEQVFRAAAQRMRESLLELV